MTEKQNLVAIDLTKGTVLIHNDTESLTKEVWKLQPYEAYMIELLQ